MRCPPPRGSRQFGDEPIGALMASWPVVAEWLTVAEVAARIRMSEDYVARQCRFGRLRATKLGHARRISRDAVDEFMSAAAEPTPRPGRSARRLGRRV
ncbi:helix-turn-helix domain-containing protein [Pimelobacter simplex]|uniref:helix-turn-helix domain-containing protein n=1 Tax=Nocardioides simplex TaxID=2045 RepID=UPI00367031DA